MVDDRSVARALSEHLLTVGQTTMAIVRKRARRSWLTGEGGEQLRPVVLVEAPGPAYVAVSTPGRPPRAATSRPVSSARPGRPRRRRSPPPSDGRCRRAFRRPRRRPGPPPGGAATRSPHRGCPRSRRPSTGSPTRTRAGAGGDGGGGHRLRARGGSAIISAWRSTISASPRSARSSNARSSEWLNGALGGALDLDEPVLAAGDRANRDHVHVDVGRAVLGVGRSSTGTPPTMPTLTAAQNECSGWAASAPAPARRGEGVVEGEEPSADARRARAAVGLQHVAVDDDLALAEDVRSHAARSDRPMSRWISTVRPLCLPLAASRSTRSGDDPGQHRVLGSHPALPGPAHPPRGTLSSTLAVHSTLVRPNVTRQEPSAISV